MTGTRAEYEAEVRGIAETAAAMLAGGATTLQVAHWAVRWRNELKSRYRAGLPANIIDLIEARNLVKYGDKLGPKAQHLFERYGSWESVIDAATRPADLKNQRF